MKSKTKTEGPKRELKNNQHMTHLTDEEFAALVRYSQDRKISMSAATAGILRIRFIYLGYLKTSKRRIK